MLRFWLPIASPWGLIEQEIFPPPQVAEMLLRVCVHEAGHAEVAAYWGATVQGVAITNEPTGFGAMTIYQLPDGLSIEQTCTIMAAGSAAEKLHYGNYTQEGATRDQHNIRELCEEVSYELLVEKATRILAEGRENFDRVTTLLRQRLVHSDGHLTMRTLENGSIGAYILQGYEMLKAGPARAESI